LRPVLNADLRRLRTTNSKLGVRRESLFDFSAGSEAREFVDSLFEVLNFFTELVGFLTLGCCELLLESLEATLLDFLVDFGLANVLTFFDLTAILCRESAAVPRASDWSAPATRVALTRRIRTANPRRLRSRWRVWTGMAGRAHQRPR